MASLLATLVLDKEAMTALQARGDGPPMFRTTLRQLVRTMQRLKTSRAAAAAAGGGLLRANSNMSALGGEGHAGGSSSAGRTFGTSAARWSSSAAGAGNDYRGGWAQARKDQCINLINNISTNCTVVHPEHQWEGYRSCQPAVCCMS